MAKSTCFLALFVIVVVCAEAIRIDTRRPARRQEDIRGVKKNDERCKEGNGLYPDPKDCTRYFKCVDGNSQEKKCPENMKFDQNTRHCVFPSQNPNCGNSSSSPSHEDVKCPKSYGRYPVESDCHKYMDCTDGVPTLVDCPDQQFYSNVNGFCIESDKCPQEQSGEPSVCKMANGVFPVPGDSHKYIKCVNFKSQTKTCPSGKAFNKEKHTCVNDSKKARKTNDIRYVEPDE